MSRSCVDIHDRSEVPLLLPGDTEKRRFRSSSQEPPHPLRGLHAPTMCDGPLLLPGTIGLAATPSSSLGSPPRIPGPHGPIGVRQALLLLPEGHRTSGDPLLLPGVAAPSFRGLTAPTTCDRPSSSSLRAIGPAAVPTSSREPPRPNPHGTFGPGLSSSLAGTIWRPAPPPPWAGTQDDGGAPPPSGVAVFISACRPSPCIPRPRRR